jgi:hypothetical protein
MDDDIEQLLDFGLEFEGLWSGGGHGIGNRGRELTAPRMKINVAGRASTGQF